MADEVGKAVVVSKKIVTLDPGDSLILGISGFDYDAEAINMIGKFFESQGIHVLVIEGSVTTAAVNETAFLELMQDKEDIFNAISSGDVLVVDNVVSMEET